MGDGHHVYSDGSRLCLYLTAVVDWFSRRVLAWRVSISMDGRGSWRDNVFIERLWCSVRYEEVYLRVAEARGSIGGYLAFYNRKRPHSSLNGRTPDYAYFGGVALAEAA